MAITLKAVAPLDAEAALPMALLMQHLKDPEGEDLVANAARLGALNWIERRVGVSLTRRPWRVIFGGLQPGQHELRLPMGPVSVTGITYRGAGGVPQSWTPGSWRFDGAIIRTASGISWFAAFADMAVTVEYVAGYDDLAAEEPALQTAALLLAGHFYRNREENAPVVLASMPFGVKLLIEDIRMPVLA